MADEKLFPCPHCGHHPYEPDREKCRDRYGEWDWVIRCSSSHCRAEVSICADGWQEGERTRLTDLRQKWNRRVNQQLKEVP
jgi:hypothetical protein